MADRVASHYSENLELADVIAQNLQSAGRDLNKLTTTDLATVDEFHIRGRKATLELAAKMNLNANSHVLDIGSGLGGPARTLAETCGCQVTGIDLTQAFCNAATAMSDWVGLGKRVSFQARGRYEPAFRQPEIRCGDDNPRCDEYCCQGQDVYGSS
jgi:2-polyprenyl-3-methyl-5-hydroxy-6-metoxy-1,4-benzoquinol methylase